MGQSALVVDDNSANRLLAARLLKRLGWEVEEAPGGVAALAILAETRHDLMLLDINMPDLSGEEVCSIVRHRGQAIRVLAYTAHAHASDLGRFLETGFDGLLLKPLTRVGLVEALVKLGLAPPPSPTSTP